MGNIISCNSRYLVNILYQNNVYIVLLYYSSFEVNVHKRCMSTWQDYHQKIHAVLLSVSYSEILCGTIYSMETYTRVATPRNLPVKQIST